MKQKIVIVGGGFGGLYTLKHLQESGNKDVDLTLISEQNFFTFTPMLHEAATGGLDFEQIIQPIPEITHRNANFINEKVESIELNTKTVKTNSNEYTYDYLVIATGAVTNYYGIEGADKHSIGLKTIWDAQKVKNSIIQLLQKDTAKIRITVVGAGPTGIELAFEVLEYTNEIKKNHSSIDIEITIVTAADCILPYFSKKSQVYVESLINKRGMKLLKNAAIVKVTADKMHLASGAQFDTNLTLWAAGVRANVSSITGNTDFIDTKDQLKVDDTLRVVGYSDVFGVGDVVSGFPMLAYTATRQAKYVADSIDRLVRNDKGRLKPFKFKPAVKLLSLGQRNAIGEFYGVVFAGPVIWFLWRTVYLSKIPSLKRKIKIMLNWTFNLFADRDTTLF